MMPSRPGIPDKWQDTFRLGYAQGARLADCLAPKDIAKLRRRLEFDIELLNKYQNDMRDPDECIRADATRDYYRLLGKTEAIQAVIY